MKFFALASICFFCAGYMHDQMHKDGFRPRVLQDYLHYNGEHPVLFLAWLLCLVSGLRFAYQDGRKHF